ncbi:MAG: helix-turn-helix transcriptional regulator [Pseudodesulfovibrio sp.]|uniref:helix-turn-helix transcriptional regulator n=1 Tax=Pseudodesulfovibrio sp. TaxID=2035812 RepID=UPI003D142DE4
MVAKSNDTLNGMNEICAYVGMSAPTILKWIRGKQFPAKQDARNCIWRSSKKKVDEWNERYANGEV